VIDPSLSIIQRAVYQRVLALHLPRGARVLDAPCGAGALAIALNHEGLSAFGADIDATAATPLGEAFRAADLSAPLPWSDEFFDVALSVEGIEHLENRQAYLRELRRVLTPGGTLILTTPNVSSVRSRVRFAGSGFFHHDPRPLREAAPHPLHHIGLMTFADLRYALHTCGFRIVRVGRTHVKPISWLYGFLVPWMWTYTRIAFRKERDPAQRRANRQILGALFSPSVLFGENLLIVARCHDLTQNTQNSQRRNA
jgi:2-polyprenyl-3-methyl-5-hydroxy-6-metoxy-1,4-benzoquinol methylase